MERDREEKKASGSSGGAGGAQGGAQLLDAFSAYWGAAAAAGAGRSAYTASSGPPAPQANAAWWQMASHLAAQDYLARLQGMSAMMPGLGAFSGLPDPYAALQQLSSSASAAPLKPSSVSSRSKKASLGERSRGRTRQNEDSKASADSGSMRGVGSGGATGSSISAASTATLTYNNSRSTPSPRHTRKGSSNMGVNAGALLRPELMLQYQAAAAAALAGSGPQRSHKRPQDRSYSAASLASTADAHHRSILSSGAMSSNCSGSAGALRLPPDTEIIKYTSSMAGPKVGAIPGNTNRGRKKTISLEPDGDSKRRRTESSSGSSERDRVELYRLGGGGVMGGAGMGASSTPALDSLAGLHLLNAHLGMNSPSSELLGDFGSLGGSGTLSHRHTPTAAAQEQDECELPLNLSLKPSNTTAEAEDLTMGVGGGHGQGKDALERLTHLSQAITPLAADRISRRKAAGGRPRRVPPDASTPLPSASTSDEDMPSRPRNLGRGVSKPKKNTVASLLAASRALGVRPQALLAMKQASMDANEAEKLKQALMAEMSSLEGCALSTDSECPSDSSDGSSADTKTSQENNGNAGSRLQLAKRQQALREAKREMASRNRDQARLAKEAERGAARREREIKAQLANEAKRRRQEESERMRSEEQARRQQEKEMKRQQAVLAKEQERERRRQHTGLVRLLDSRRRFEERERRRARTLVTRLIEKEKKREERRKELELLTELRRPQEDSCLAEQKKMPDFNRIPGVLLPGLAVADMLMVFEFIHNFASILGIEGESLPTLHHFQNGLIGPNYLNRLEMTRLEDNKKKVKLEGEREDCIRNGVACQSEISPDECLLLDLLGKLLAKAIEDPGIPHPLRYTLLLGLCSLRSPLEDSRLGFGEVLRVYLYACATGEVKTRTGISQEREREKRIPDHHQSLEELQLTASHPKNKDFYQALHANTTYRLSKKLMDKPFLALSPTVKLKILAFICNELLQNKAIIRQIDTALETTAQLKKDRQIAEAKVRKLRALHGRRIRTDAAVERMQRLTDDNLHHSSSLHDDKDEESLLMDVGLLNDCVNKAQSPYGSKAASDKDGKLSLSLVCDKDGNNDDDVKMPSLMGSDDESESTQPEEDEDKMLSADELLKKLERMQRQCEEVINHHNQSALSVRATCYGQDRYWRRYWQLANLGGIFVEAMESAQPEIINYHENLEKLKHEEENIKMEGEIHSAEKQKSNKGRRGAKRRGRKKGKGHQMVKHPTSLLEDEASQSQNSDFNNRDSNFEEDDQTSQSFRSTERIEPNESESEVKTMEHNHLPEEVSSNSWSGQFMDGSDKANSSEQPAATNTASETINTASLEASKEVDGKNVAIIKYESNKTGAAAQPEGSKSESTTQESKVHKDEEMLDIENSIPYFFAFLVHKPPFSSDDNADNSGLPKETKENVGKDKEFAERNSNNAYNAFHNNSASKAESFNSMKLDENNYNNKQSMPLSDRSEKDATSINEDSGPLMDANGNESEDFKADIKMELPHKMEINDHSDTDYDKCFPYKAEIVDQIVPDVPLEESACDVISTLLNDKIFNGTWFSILRKEIINSNGFISDIQNQNFNLSDLSPDSKQFEICPNVNFTEDRTSCTDICMSQGNKWDLFNNLHLLNDPAAIFSFNISQCENQNISYMDSILTLSGLDQKVIDGENPDPTNGEASSADLPPDNCQFDTIDIKAGYESPNSKSDDKKVIKSELGSLPKGVLDKNIASYLGSQMLDMTALSTYLSSVESLPGQMLCSEESELLEWVKKNGLPQKIENNFVESELRVGWWLLQDMDLIHQLLGCLNLRGVRERQLHDGLMEILSNKVNLEMFIPMARMEGTEPSHQANCKQQDQVWCLNEFSKEAVMRIELAVLTQVENLEERVMNASLQTKGYRPVKSPHNLNNIIHEAAARLADLEMNIERRYLKPPLGQSTTDATILAIQSELSHGGTVSAGSGVSVGCSTSTSSSNNSLHSTSSSSLKDDDFDGRNDGKVSRALCTWRDAVVRCFNADQVIVALSLLDKSIAWERSVMKAFCQFCGSGEREDSLLLCDGCDKGCHTYCFRPPVTVIPEGDWYCYECINRATGERCCIVCGLRGNATAPPPLAPGIPNPEKGGWGLRRLVVCGGCPKAYHAGCHTPVLTKVPRGKWYCNDCPPRPPPPKKPKSSHSSKKQALKGGGDTTPNKTKLDDSIDTGCTSFSNSPTEQSSEQTSFCEKMDNEVDNLQTELDVELNNFSDDSILKAMSLEGDLDVKEKEKLCLKDPPAAVKETSSKRKEKKRDKESKKKERDKDKEKDRIPLQTENAFLEICRNILSGLECHIDAWPFLEPVNTKQFPTYKKVIRNPIDLSLIRKKLEDNCYTGPEDMAEDVRRMLSNCEVFNEDDSPVGQAGHSLHKHFLFLWEQHDLP